MVVQVVTICYVELTHKMKTACYHKDYPGPF